MAQGIHILFPLISVYSRQLIACLNDRLVDCNIWKRFELISLEPLFTPVLDCLRNGSTIALINIAPLKNKDIVELKRAVNKLKKTCDALEGDLAGFGEDYIVATPEFAYVQRNKSETPTPTDNIDDDEM